ncbi:DUF1361 domain-containing protein [Paenibacillus piri]|uniref:DUF1361 domain-containing protein n=1 Tax=Paenibacillus piri TaxID=2547395 RepID=A0A4R5KVP3_9BACL|nr:DUF1361 domain-containing protein [Paenibacillus piri]TDF99185.1 DUF1361 domain-containing protein [Paenibacillus piri]
MKELQHTKLTLFLVVLTLLNVIVYAIFRNKTYLDFLIWNLFLSWLPFIFSGSVLAVLRRKPFKLKTALLVCLCVAWLLFFPNAPYVISDFVHVTVLKSNYLERGRLNFNYWYDFLVIYLFSWTCLLLGVVSTYQLHGAARKRFGKIAAWLFVMFVSFLGGYGVLLGREYRLNSWDVIANGHIIASIIKTSLYGRAIIFGLLFGLVISIIYITFYFFINGASLLQQRETAEQEET